MKKKSNNQHIASAVAVASILSLGVAPVWAQQQNSLSRQESSSQSRQQSTAAGGMVAASTLEGHRVLDSNNREIGTINSLFIDPQSGRIQRADIDFSVGTNQTYSVKWDQLNVKQRGQELVVTLDQSVVQRVQQAAAKAQREGAYSQEQRSENRPREADSGAGVFGLGDNKQNDQWQMSASQLNPAQIRKIQQGLNKQGFHAGQVNGQWSSETQTAIRNFQQAKGLKATGQLDQRTINELGLDADEFRKNSDKSSGSSSSGR